MFKKLKQKINEEQSPQRNAQAAQQQAQMGIGDRRSSQTPPFHHDGSPSPSDRQMLAGMIAEPAFLSEYTIFALDHSKQPKTAQVASVNASRGPARSPRGSINGDGNASPNKEDSQSFVQKLKVPSMESLIRGGASRAENLFRSSSKENLVRSASRESLTPLGENEPSGGPAYDPPSDIESEAEDPPGSAEALSKEQLLHRLLQVERSLGKYRGKYSELVTAYRTVQREKEKTQTILSQSQDKALRRIGELREELQMDQQAKKHLQDEFDAALEEKDQMITVLQTQVALFKKQVKGVSDGPHPSEGDALQSEVASDSTSAAQSPSKEQRLEPEIAEVEGNSDPARLIEALQKRVKRQENLLQKCKEVMRTHKEQSTQLSSENEALQEQLQERLQELEKMKDLHTTEKTKLITQLRDAKNLIEQLEQDKGMVIAETKWQMHETLEMKEEEIAQCRSRLQQAVAQKEELQEQKEKAEKSAFEELERALVVAQRAEEARKQLQVQLEQRVKEVERASEEERKSLQQELTRVKQEVVTIMKKSSEETVANMEKTHSEALAAKEEEMKERVSKAVEQCKKEFEQLSKEREQQASLALEDAELQKNAIRTEADNKVKDIQLELEAARTRILEMESSVNKISEDESGLSHELSSPLEELKISHKEQITALKEKQEELEKDKDALIQQLKASLEDIKEKHRVEMETLLKDKELQFQVHVEDMNQKTLEKLDRKQAELEVLSAELSEVFNSKQILEERLVAVQETAKVAQQKYEQKLQDQISKHSVELENIKHEHEQSIGGIEKTLKQELNALKIVLREKDKEIKDVFLKEKTVQEKALSTAQNLEIKIREIEELEQSLLQTQQENTSLKEINAQLNTTSEDLDQCKKSLTDLKDQLEVANNNRQEKENMLQEIRTQLEETKKELLEKEKTYAADQEKHLEELKCLKKQLDDDKATHEMLLKDTISEMQAKVNKQETKMEKLKQKAKEMQENFKKRLQQGEENMKKELAKKEVELQQKEQQVQEKIVEMAQKSSQGLSSAVSELQANHKEELEKLHTVRKQEMEALGHRWQEKLAQQEEELTEKHSLTLQDKAQELEETSLQLTRSCAEYQQVSQELKNLKEDLAIRETTVQKLQEELNEAAVKLESLSQGEALLKEQMELTERNLNQALNERNTLQEELKTAKEEGRVSKSALSDKLNETEKLLEALESFRITDAKDMESKIEQTSTQLQAKEAEFQQHLNMIINKMDRYCKEVQSKLECSSDELQQRVESRMKELNDRLLCSQGNVGRLQSIVRTKLGRICTLEENLLQHTEENKNLCNSLEHMTAQVESHMEHIKALTREKENSSLSISEQLQKMEELSETNIIMSESLKTNELFITDLKNQLASSMEDKEEAINKLKEQYEKERQDSMERLEQEWKAAVEQANALRISLMEQEKNAKTIASKDDDTIKSLHMRLEELEKEISEKNKALQRLSAKIDNQSISKSEMDQVLSEKEQKVCDLTTELDGCISRLSELQEQFEVKTKECEQLASELKRQHISRENEKKELMEKLQQVQTQCSQNGNLEQELGEKLSSLEEENKKCKLVLESQREEFERMKDEINMSKEESLKATEERLSAESTLKISELKKKAEQKISQIRKQLTAQLEEKEQTIKSLQGSLEENRSNETLGKKQMETLEEKTKLLEEALVRLREEQEKNLEQILSNERLEKEKSLEELRGAYEEKLMSLQKEAAQQVELRVTETEMHEHQAKLKEAEEQIENLLTEINRLKAEISEKDAQLCQSQMTPPDRVQSSSELEAVVKVESSNLQQATSVMENEAANHSPMQQVGDVDVNCLQSFENELSQMKNEKEKIQKEFTRLQKDMRQLRKEHEHDLEYVKKELLEENEKRLKLELEDMEMKQNSAIKQLMREFNTQMALKERELDSTVKETIAKAQAVEAELISSHRDEASQLRKVISQKDEDLQRTVQKYEQVIQMTPEDLKAQLAEKTTLLSEARLKEQEFVERIHSLEDKIKFLHRSSVVTHLGGTFKDPGINTSDTLSESTEMEYLRKVLFEYMMGRETKTMAKVITSMLKFSPDQAQKVLDKEDSKPIPWLR
ncbi:golgin subfamily A member 4 isoform X3 [Girardinichthys multiradiatus]|uniref:golgin subfamily A member 4 isoform X3 n=1 Tax=Girardinichthys multiradiatus TaxID=208333 RepID=UPI001FAD4BAB|nr:golgin subfamily A member 4 isoform X3 [Girardinichthys multiradiatus]